MQHWSYDVESHHVHEETVHAQEWLMCKLLHICHFFEDHFNLVLLDHFVLEERFDCINVVFIMFLSVLFQSCQEDSSESSLTKRWFKRKIWLLCFFESFKIVILEWKLFLKRVIFKLLKISFLLDIKNNNIVIFITQNVFVFSHFLNA